MSIRTLDELDSVLTRELTWRKKEMREMQQMVADKKTAHMRERLLLRAAIALLYAHWEGFVKVGGTSYLDFVHHKHLINNDVSLPILALSGRSMLNTATGANRTVVHLNITRFYLEKGAERCRIPYDTAIRTSNLNYELFVDITRMLGLDLLERETATKKNLIDEELLGNRNRIAHGEHLLITAELYNGLHTEVINLITLFHNELLNAALQRRYLRFP